MLRSGKLALWKAARAAGAFALVRRSAWRRERLLILCYHGLALEREHEWDPSLFMSADRFRRRLERIRAGGTPVLPLGEAVSRLREGRLERPSVAITFDDGFCDFRRLAVPMLREFGFPATVYLTTYYVDDGRPIPNLVIPYMLWLGGKSGGPDAVLDDRLDADAKDAQAARVARSVGLDYDDVKRSRVLSLMTPEETAEVAADPLVDVQLHTHRHRTPDDETLFRREIADNRRRIEQLTGVADTEHFCYPSGVYRPTFLPWLRAEGVRTATTCDPGLAAPDAEPLLLPRKIDTMVVSEVEFDAWLSGFEPRVRALAGR